MVGTVIDEKKFCIVNGYQMAYVETNSDGFDDSTTTLLFLHGNPTSSYLWRNVMKPLAQQQQKQQSNRRRRRLIAPDLIGMGDSDKLNETTIDSNSYRFVQHVTFLDGLLDCILDIDEKVWLIIHDWGSALGFWWARRYPYRIHGIAFMESVVQPLFYDTMYSETANLFRLIRTPNIGEELILQQNYFVEVVLPDSIIRNLTDEEMNVYREPYLETGNDRLPTLIFPREVPIDGIPEDVNTIVANYSNWMGTDDDADFPKLFINADPGGIVLDNEREFIRTTTWKTNLTEVTVAGIHFIQEDSPNEIAQAIDAWVTANTPPAPPPAPPPPLDTNNKLPGSGASSGLGYDPSNGLLLFLSISIIIIAVLFLQLV